MSATNIRQERGARAFFASLLVLLSGCMGADPDFGHSVKAAIAAQAVDMTPAYAGTPVEGGEAVVAVAAQRRYLEGRVKKLTPITVTGDSGRINESTDKPTGRKSGE